MLHAVTLRTLVVAACAMVLAGEGAALTLGTPQGPVLIGRPLELIVPVTLDAGEDAPCARGELLHGDDAVRPPSVQWVPGSAGQGVLRIVSPLPVQEPSITLSLQAGCRQVSSRRYVLLADVPQRAEAPVAAAAAGAPQVRRDVARADASVRLRSAAVLPARPSRAARPSPAARPAASTGRPRLQLEALDLTVESHPILRLSSELGAQLAADAGRRDAAAALWQILQKTPEQAMQEALRLENAERELKSLQTATQHNAAAVAQMRAQVERARSDRGAAALLVMGLSLLLAGILAGLAWQWYRAARMARVGRWFEAHGESVQAPLPPTPVQPPAAPVHAAPPTAPVSAWAPAEDYQASRGGSVRMVGVEELIDVRDKADFFLSIGETRQAVAVLEAHVHDQVETSALAWMDLLELYHRLGMRDPFDRLRAEFRQVFTGQVPDFEHFDQPTPSLEHYSRALSRIVALWPSRKVLDVIEESIFRKPGLPGAEPFSLEAYRELVLLYHVARDLAAEGQEEGRYSDTSLQPLNALDAAEPAHADIDLLLIPPSTPRIGVDIELGADRREEPSALDFDITGAGALAPAPDDERR